MNTALLPPPSLPAPPVPEAPKKTRKKAFLFFGAAVGLVAVGAVAGAGYQSANNAQVVTKAPVVTEAMLVTEEPVVTEAPAPTTTEAPATTLPPARVFTTNDFAIDLLVMESQCFDSAGALVTVEPNLNTLSGSPDPGQSFTLVYEIHGGEFVETFSIDVEGTSYTYDEEVISTASCNYNLTADVVRLIER